MARLVLEQMSEGSEFILHLSDSDQMCLYNRIKPSQNLQNRLILLECCDF